MVPVFYVKNVGSTELKYVYLIFLSESRHIIWTCRNSVKHEKISSPLELIIKFMNRIQFRITLDFHRLTHDFFYLYWGGLCHTTDETVVFHADLDYTNYVKFL